MMSKAKALEAVQEVFGQYAQFVELRDVRVNNVVVRREIIGPDVEAYKEKRRQRDIEERKPKPSNLLGTSSLLMMFGMMTGGIQMPLRVWGSGRTWDEAFEDMVLRR
jgi:hypothetical protein